MSELTDMRAFGDIEAEIEAEREADPSRKKLGVFFWICVGWIALKSRSARRLPPCGERRRP